MTKLSVVALLIACFGPVAAGPAAAQGIVRSQDAQGHPSYSNRGGNGSSESAPAPGAGGEQGWESVLERRQGQVDVVERAEAAINSLELQVTLKKRERDHAQEELQATQADIVRAVESRSAGQLPTLKARETSQAKTLRKFDIEIALLKLQIAKLRALKEAERQRRTTP